jgi:hypothetical protein
MPGAAGSVQRWFDFGLNPAATLFVEVARLVARTHLGLALPNHSVHSTGPRYVNPSR